MFNSIKLFANPKELISIHGDDTIAFHWLDFSCSKPVN